MIDFSNKSTPDLLDRLCELNRDIASIKQQLLEYVLDDSVTNRDWYARATYARKCAAIEYSDINTELSKRKKAAAKEFSQAFVTVAKEELPEEVFYQIFNKAKEASTIC